MGYADYDWPKRVTPNRLMVQIVTHIGNERMEKGNVQLRMSTVWTGQSPTPETMSPRSRNTARRIEMRRGQVEPTSRAVRPASAAD
jgi:hypothetical protein